MAHWAQLRSWLQLVFAAFGGLGLFLAAFLDSSFIPLPLVSDLLLMELSSRHPVRMPYYVLMAALGSLGGCVWIYWLARKGGQAYFGKAQTHRPGRIRRFIYEHPIASVFLPAVAPFPVPFKPFVIAQGAFQVPFTTFVVFTLAGRGLLFFSEGFLGARYGAAAKELIINQKWAAIAVATAAAIFLLVRHISALRGAPYSRADCRPLHPSDFSRSAAMRPPSKPEEFASEPGSCWPEHSHKDG